MFRRHKTKSILCDHQWSVYASLAGTNITMMPTGAELICCGACEHAMLQAACLHGMRLTGMDNDLLPQSISVYRILEAALQRGAVKPPEAQTVRPLDDSFQGTTWSSGTILLTVRCKSHAVMSSVSVPISSESTIITPKGCAISSV